MSSGKKDNRPSRTDRSRAEERRFKSEIETMTKECVKIIDTTATCFAETAESGEKDKIGEKLAQEFYEVEAVERLPPGPEQDAARKAAVLRWGSGSQDVNVGASTSQKMDTKKK